MIPSTTIKDMELPVCKNCRYFIPFENKEQYLLGRCSLFGKKNIITGEITYEFADICRFTSTKCGYNGTLYEDI
jgi:hypothetical protein